MSDGDTASHVGPVIFSDETARRQLCKCGEVITFRYSDRTTGSTWWRKSRTGEKCGDVCIERVCSVDPSSEEQLREYVELSGFSDVSSWQDAIREVNSRSGESGFLYRVVSHSE